jgi:hypothetical protein
VSVSGHPVRRYARGQARQSAQGGGEGAAQGRGKAGTGSTGRAWDAAHRGWGRRGRRVRRGRPTTGENVGRWRLGPWEAGSGWCQAAAAARTWAAEGGDARRGKGDRGGKYRSPLQEIMIWRVKFFGGSSKHTFIG